MKICVIGTGYVGLVAGAGFADMGNDVICCDVDAAKIEGLKRGVMPIYEPGLDKLVMHNVAEGRLTFTTDVAERRRRRRGHPARGRHAARPRRLAPICQYIFKAAEQVGERADRLGGLVTKSTVPVGTGDKIEAIVKKRAKHEFAVASNPEFLKEGRRGQRLHEARPRRHRRRRQARDRHAARALRAVHAHAAIACWSWIARSAELTKYAANSMLATRISFMNDLANLCELLGADIELVRKGMGSDPRIGPKFLFAGPGFGGTCFPKDSARRDQHRRARSATSSRSSTRSSPSTSGRSDAWARRSLAHFGGDARRASTIAVWGLAFKPGTDDIREAPALVLIDQLLAAGATVRRHRPGGDGRPCASSSATASRYEESNYDCAKGADALVLVTEWHEFRRPSFERLKTLHAASRCCSTAATSGARGAARRRLHVLRDGALAPHPQADSVTSTRLSKLVLSTGGATLARGSVAPGFSPLSPFSSRPV